MIYNYKKSKFGINEFKWNAKTQKEGEKEDRQRCEGSENFFINIEDQELLHKNLVFFIFYYYF